MLNRLTARWTERVLAVSPIVKSIVAQRDGIPDDKLAVWVNGIDLRAIDKIPKTAIRREFGFSGEDVIFCSVGRLVEDKGYVYLIRAMAQLTGGPRRIRLLLVGEGPEEDRLRREARRVGVADEIRFLGFRKDVPGFLKDVDGFVLSFLEEGVPIVVLEAMACSLPVIATRVGGVPDLVEEEQTGLLGVPEEDWLRSRRLVEGGRAEVARADGRGVEALAEAMAQLAADAELRESMGRQGRLRVEELYDIERIVSQLERFYDRARQARGS